MRIFKLRRVEVVILIYHQIPVTNLQGNELKLEGRIHNWILEVKGLIPCLFCIPWLSILSKRHFGHLKVYFLFLKLFIFELSFSVTILVYFVFFPS